MSVGNKRINTIHIHTDLKFIRETRLFYGSYFKNQVIFIGNKESYKGDYADEIIFIKRNYLGYKKIVKICNSSDLVVLYDLDTIKSAIANSLSDDVQIAWRFFGYELYKKKRDHYISSQSKGIISDYSRSGKSVVFQLLSRIRPIHLLPDSSFEKAVSRINYFLCLSRMEYDELLGDWPNLPECIVLSIWTELNACQPEELWRIKEPVLIVGNNKSIYNNHLDVINKLDVITEAGDYQIIVPFSYGSEGEYSKAVRFKVREKSNCTLLENFLPYHEYNKVIRESFALIINSYRQIGMESIFMAIEGGVKVYLNKKNIIYAWLKSKGVKVFDVNSLVTDFKKGETRLSIFEIESNIQALRDINNEYPKSEFQRTMFEKVCDQE